MAKRLSWDGAKRAVDEAGHYAAEDQTAELLATLEYAQRIEGLLRALIDPRGLGATGSIQEVRRLEREAREVLAEPEEDAHGPTT